MAFELLFKSIHLYNFDKFESTHDLKKLSKDVLEKESQTNSKDLLALINNFQFMKYPIDKGLLSKKTNLKIDGFDYVVGEIGSKDLEDASYLFDTICQSLQERYEEWLNIFAGARSLDKYFS